MLAYLKSKKFLGLVVIIVLILIIVPLTFIFVTHPTKLSTKNTTQKIKAPVFAATDKLATFNGIPIYVKDLNTLAMEIYQTTDAKNLNAANIDNLLNIYIERKILDKQNIGDVNTLIPEVEKSTGLTGNQAKYEALKEKFTTTAQKSWSAYTIEIWIQPITADGSLINGTSKDNTSQNKQARIKLLSDVNNALDYAKTQMQNGVSVFNIATQIDKNYPSLINIIGVNTLRFGGSTNPSFWNKPATYYYDNNIASDPFSKTLYTMTENSPVTKVLNINNMGGHVIKIVKVNNPNGMLDNYADWLKTQESGLKFVNSDIQKMENSR